MSSNPEGDDGGEPRKPGVAAVASTDAPAASTDARTADTRTADARTADARGADAVADARIADARGVHARSADAVADARSAGARSADPVGAAAAEFVVDDEPVPRLPRSWGFKVPTQALVKIAMTAALLAMIIVARRPCADSVSDFVTDFDKTGSAVDQMPKPGRIDVAPAVDVGSAGDYETLRPDMTEAEIKAAIERAKARAAGSSKGSAGSADPPAGSATAGSATAGSSSVGSASPGSASGP